MACTCLMFSISMEVLVWVQNIPMYLIISLLSYKQNMEFFLLELGSIMIFQDFFYPIYIYIFFLDLVFDL